MVHVRSTECISMTVMELFRGHFERESWPRKEGL